MREFDLIEPDLSTAGNSDLLKFAGDLGDLEPNQGYIYIYIYREREKQVIHIELARTHACLYFEASMEAAFRYLAEEIRLLLYN